ncbi:MAG: putative ABC exporter domain-containing protein [Clostridiales bacterium]|nr:putative ABC exporter domain-containing protein [Clostridiales bacterium]
MNAILYLIWRSLVGIVRNFKKKKGQLVLVVFLVVIFGVMIVGNNQVDDLAQWIPTDYLTTAYATIVLIVAALTIDNGIKKGSSSYRMADVQFVFPSPISPKLILIYGFLKQFAISILVVLWFVFQSFNIRNIFGLTAQGFSVFLLVTFIVVMYMPVVSMWLYSITLRKQGAKRIMQRIFLGLGAVLAIAIVTLTIIKGDPIEAAQIFLGGSYFQYIPILGWLVTLLNAAKLGFDTWTWISLALLVAGFVLILWRLLSSEIPFYEEVLKQTVRKEKQIAAKKGGMSNMNLNSKKARKATITYKGTGPKALFYRQLLEYKKAGFLLFDRVTVILLVLGVVGGYVLKNTGLPISIALYAAIYLNFIFAFSGKWVKEMNNPFIYIMPGTALAKLWYATAANHLKHLVDGTAIFVPIAILTKLDPVVTLGFILAYAAIGAIYIYADVLSRRVFGKLHKGNIANIFKMLCILFVLSPALVGYIIITSMFPDVILIQWLAPLGIVAYSTVINLLIMLFGKKIFVDVELI